MRPNLIGTISEDCHPIIQAALGVREPSKPAEAATPLILEEVAVTPKPRLTRPLKTGSRGKALWPIYSDEYHNRYGTEPLRNAKVNTQLKRIATAIPQSDWRGVLSSFFNREGWYAQKGHSLGVFESDLQKIYTEYKTGKVYTRQQGRSGELWEHNTQAVQNMLARKMGK